MEKRLYGQWNKENMQNAIDAYRNKEYGLNECCRRFRIPKPTFKRHLQGAVKRPLSYLKKNGNLPTLSEDIEKMLVKHILQLESNFFGLSITDVRRLAFQIAEKHEIQHKFNRKTKLAGKKWFYSFIKRYPNLSIQQPENTSMARAGFNEEAAVNLFFDILQDNVRLNGIDASRIYNINESGFSTVQKKCGKIVAHREKKRIGRIVSGERVLNTTLVCCANAAGSFVPPMFIFKRKRLAPQLGRGVPPGSLIEVAEHGFITSELFVKWLQHFIDCVKPTLERKIILLLDGRTTHTKNLEALELAQSNGIILMQLPGHTTHKLQPLDVGIFGRMQISYNQALDQWKTCNAGKYITQYDIAPLITSAYFKSATIGNATSAFKASGCWPVNRFVFNNVDFAANEFFNEPEVLIKSEVLIEPEVQQY